MRGERDTLCSAEMETAVVSGLSSFSFFCSAAAAAMAGAAAAAPTITTAAVPAAAADNSLE